MTSDDKESLQNLSYMKIADTLVGGRRACDQYLYTPNQGLCVYLDCNRKGNSSNHYKYIESYLNVEILLSNKMDSQLFSRGVNGDRIVTYRDPFLQAQTARPSREKRVRKMMEHKT